MTQPPDPLRPQSLAVLAEYRAQRNMPDDARARVGDRLLEDATPPVVPTPAWRWVAVGGALAAAVVAALVLNGDRRGVQQPDARPSEAQLEGPVSGTEGTAQPAKPRPAQARAPSAPHAATHAKPPALQQLPPETSAPRDPLEGAPSTPRKPNVANAVPTNRPHPSPRAQPKPAAPSDAPAPAVSTLGDENRLISAAWRHVTAKAFSQATTVIDGHAQRFPKGVLAPERRALRVIVNCLHEGAGESAAKAFATRHPRSPLLKKLREACGPTSQKANPLQETSPQK